MRLSLQATTIYLWLITLTASKELSILLLKLYNDGAIGISSSSLYNQVFFLKKSMFSKIVYLVNEPNLWVSPCIWYENRGFGVYKAERLSNSICLAIVCPFHSMAANLPFLPGSPSFFGWVLTSFVPPAHKQGASSAFLQGHSPMELIPAGYRLILCLQVFADLSFHATAPFGRRFPCIFPVVISYS